MFYPLISDSYPLTFKWKNNPIIIRKILYDKSIFSPILILYIILMALDVVRPVNRDHIQGILIRKFKRVLKKSKFVPIIFQISILKKIYFELLSLF